MAAATSAGFDATIFSDIVTATAAAASRSFGWSRYPTATDNDSVVRICFKMSRASRRSSSRWAKVMISRNMAIRGPLGMSNCRATRM